MRGIIILFWRKGDNLRVDRRNFLKISGLTGAYVMSASANELNPLKSDKRKTFIGGCPVNW